MFKAFRIFTQPKSIILFVSFEILTFPFHYIAVFQYSILQNKRSHQPIQFKSHHQYRIYRKRKVIPYTEFHFRCHKTETMLIGSVYVWVDAIIKDPNKIQKNHFLVLIVFFLFSVKHQLNEPNEKKMNVKTMIWNGLIKMVWSLKVRRSHKISNNSAAAVTTKHISFVDLLIVAVFICGVSYVRWVRSYFGIIKNEQANWAHARRMLPHSNSFDFKAGYRIEPTIINNDHVLFIGTLHSTKDEGVFIQSKFQFCFFFCFRSFLFCCCIRSTTLVSLKFSTHKLSQSIVHAKQNETNAMHLLSVIRNLSKSALVVAIQHGMCRFVHSDNQNNVENKSINRKNAHIFSDTLSKRLRNTRIANWELCMIKNKT